MWTVISNVKMIIWRSFVTSCFCPWKCYIRQSWGRMPDLEHVEVFSIPRAIPDWDSQCQLHTITGVRTICVVLSDSCNWGFRTLTRTWQCGWNGCGGLTISLVGVMWGGWQRSKSSSHNMVLHLKCLIVERVDIGGFGTPVQWWRGN